MAVDEIEHNLKLLNPGMTLLEMHRQAYPVPGECQQDAYPITEGGCELLTIFTLRRSAIGLAKTGNSRFSANLVTCDAIFASG